MSQNQLGFDVTREGLGFFVEHEDLPPEQMLAVLEAPGNSMSRSDRQRAKNTLFPLTKIT